MDTQDQIALWDASNDASETVYSVTNDASRCVKCGLCARLCPMGAIDPEDVYSVPGICIKCQACVRKCTKHAKYFDDPAFLSHVAMLEQTFTEPKKNEVFL